MTIQQVNIEQMKLHRDYIYDTIMFIANRATGLPCYVERENLNRPESTYISMFIETMNPLGYFSHRTVVEYDDPDTPEEDPTEHYQQYIHYQPQLTIKTWKQDANAYLMAIQAALKDRSAVEYMTDRNVAWLSESSILNASTVLDEAWEERATILITLNSYVGNIDPATFDYIDHVDITGNVYLCEESEPLPDPDPLPTATVTVNVSEECYGYVAPPIELENSEDNYTDGSDSFDVIFSFSGEVIASVSSFIASGLSVTIDSIVSNNNQITVSVSGIGIQVGNINLTSVNEEITNIDGIPLESTINYTVTAKEASTENILTITNTGNEVRELDLDGTTVANHNYTQDPWWIYWLSGVNELTIAYDAGSNVNIDYHSGVTDTVLATANLPILTGYNPYVIANERIITAERLTSTSVLFRLHSTSTGAEISNFTVTGVSSMNPAVTDMAIYRDNVYISAGIDIKIIDIITQSYIGEIDLGVTGSNIASAINGVTVLGDGSVVACYNSITNNTDISIVDATGVVTDNIVSYTGTNQVLQLATRQV